MKRIITKSAIALTLFVGFLMNVNGQNALHFDGVNDRVSTSNVLGGAISGNQITVEAWIKPSSFGVNYWSNNIVNKETWTPEAGYMLRCGAGGKLNFTLGNGSWHELISSTTVLSLNTWQHVAGTYDGAKMRIYVNGIAVDSMVAAFGNIFDAMASLTIGDYAGGGRYYGGAIDEVRVWSVARTKAEILSTMNTEICAGNPNLKAYYRFNQGVAGSNNSSVTSLIDLSSGNYPCTLNGFALTGATSNWVTGVSLPTPGISSHDTVYDSFCQGSTYSFGNQIVNTPGTYNASFFNTSGCDSLVTLILSQNTPISVTLFDTSCSGSIYHFGGLNITSSGTYNATFNASNGCDSVVVLYLFVQPVYTHVTQINSVTLQVNAINASFQWIDCNNAFSPISGATQSTFSPAQNGSYAAIVTQNSCTDTSVCMPIIGVGFPLTHSEDFHVFPNPVVDFAFIQNPLNENFRIEIYGVNGQLLKEFYSSDDLIKIDFQLFEGALFFMRIINANTSSTHKLIKMN